MAFLRRGPAAALTAGTPQSLGTISLGAPYGIVHGFNIRLYASSAKAAAGADTAAKLRLTDANGVVFYEDAADKDYATAAVEVAISHDDSNNAISGGFLTKDSVGLVTVATEGSSATLVSKSPITVTVINGGTATDYAEVYLNVEV